jgi:hypothetical protein
MQVYEFLGFREEPDQPNLLLSLHNRDRLTAELLALTIAKLQQLQFFFAEMLGILSLFSLPLVPARSFIHSSPSPSCFGPRSLYAFLFPFRFLVYFAFL